jgi:hypothetical protein
LAALHERELARGNRNRAMLAVARKLLAYLMAVDRSGKPFQPGASAMECACDEPCNQFRSVLAEVGTMRGRRLLMLPTVLFRGRPVTQT